MNKTEQWKNFSLGSELQISGSFLYNGLLCFDQMESFYNEEEVFEFLYNVSVGLERLLKVALILTEHDQINNQKELEKFLITHNIPELFRRLRLRQNLNLSGHQNCFLHLLESFYNSMRYDRFNFDKESLRDKEKYELIKFLNDRLRINIKVEILNITPNDQRIKKFIGKTIGDMVSQVYSIVSSEAHRLGIFTYEIKTYSKAYKIFIAKEYSFVNESIYRKEILAFLIGCSKDTDLMKLVSMLKPLNFESYHINHYITCLLNINDAQRLDGEVDTLYEKVKNYKERKAILDLMGSPFSLEDIEWNKEEE